MRVADPATPTAKSRQEFTCPTCGARQVATDSCRRCQCDLSLVQAAHQWQVTLHRRCLALLRQRRLHRATRVARKCCEFSPNESSIRLLAVCHLLQGNFAAVRHLGASVFSPKSDAPQRDS